MKESNLSIAGHNINFCGDLPSRASETQLSLAPLQPSTALGQALMPDHKPADILILSKPEVYTRYLSQWGK